LVLLFAVFTLFHSILVNLIHMLLLLLERVSDCLLLFRV
jgi:hypothetical protein